MASATIKLLVLILAATVAAAPQGYGPNAPSTQVDQTGPYKGYNGQAKVRVGEDTNWFKNDHQTGLTPLRESGYQCYQGDITRYPSNADWLSFDALWNINKDTILASNDGDQNIQRYIQESVLQVAKESDVDSRFILAAIMQESSGKASAPCTGHMPNCGILQASYNSHPFDPSNAPSSILEMVREGVLGTTSGGPTGQGGPGFAQFLSGGLSWVNDPMPGNPYTAARAYNSGSVAADGDLDEAGWGVRGYVNDVANRLVGWDGKGDGFEGCEKR